MPSAEETTYLIEVMQDTTQDFLARDVDILVSQIKENLRLSGLKAKPSKSRKNRPSPYRVPSRSWADPTSCEHRHINQLKRTTTRDDDDDDPYELLQRLLRDGDLIKEAVRRLQANFDELDQSDEKDLDDDEQSLVYQKKPHFYDSEDEPLPPVYEPLDL